MAGSIPALPMTIEATDELLAATVSELRAVDHPSRRGWFPGGMSAARRDVLRGRVELLLEHRWRLMRRKARPEIERLEAWWRLSWPGTSSLEAGSWEGC